MGASPSREAHENYYQELLHPPGDVSGRRRKEVTLLPLTKRFMSRVPVEWGEAEISARLAAPARGATSAIGLSFYAPEAPPARFPFIQQLYQVYGEPTIQFYFRREGWGRMDRLPEAMHHGSLEAFYRATVETYEGDLFDSNEEMQSAWERRQWSQALHTNTHSTSHSHSTTTPTPTHSSSAAAAPRDRPGLRPIPCAICFRYPTHTVLPDGTTWSSSSSSSPLTPRTSGSGRGKAGRARGHSAPPGSLVLGERCALMAVGFIGLVPAAREGGETAGRTFAKPGPATAGADTGAWEVVAFISKAAGEQHLSRALFQAAFMYVDQCRRAGISGPPPLPPLTFGCLLSDVPFLCFWREVRLRCAEAGAPPHLLRALSDVAFTRHMMLGHLSPAAAMELGVFLGEAHVHMDFHPTPPVPRYVFLGFVEDPEGRALLEASGPTVLAAAEAQADLGEAPARAAGAPATVDVFVLVGPAGLHHPRDPGGPPLPMGTVLHQALRRPDGAWLRSRWEPVAPAVDGVEPAAAPLPADLVLSWAKATYLFARTAPEANPRWQRAYPMPPPAAQPSPPSHAPPGTRTTPSTLFVWRFEANGRTYHLALIPDFSRPPGATGKTRRSSHGSRSSGEAGSAGTGGVTSSSLSTWGETPWLWGRDPAGTRATGPLGAAPRHSLTSLTTTTTTTTATITATTTATAAPGDLPRERRRGFGFDHRPRGGSVAGARRSSEGGPPAGSLRAGPSDVSTASTRPATAEMPEGASYSVLRWAGRSPERTPTQRRLSMRGASERGLSGYFYGDGPGSTRAPDGPLLNPYASFFHLSEDLPVWGGAEPSSREGGPPEAPSTAPRSPTVYSLSLGSEGPRGGPRGVSSERRGTHEATPTSTGDAREYFTDSRGARRFRWNWQTAARAPERSSM